MLHYILQTIAFQLFFLMIYDLFLKKETFFNWNRVYLLITALLSIALPFIKVEQFKDVVPQKFIIALPEIIIGNLSQLESNTTIATSIDQNTGFVFSWELLFYLGVFIALGIFVFKLIRIGLLIYKNPKRWQGDLIIVELVKSNAAFSFFYYVFLGEHIKAEDKDTILKHESIHVQQRHSIDLLVFEMLKILFWFNPLIYMYQNRITTLHEYIADAKALKSQDKQRYYENLLSQVFETQNVSFINSFFKKSLIKKRIIMIGKTKSKQILKLKYMLLLPVVLGMLMYTSCTQEKVIDDQNNSLDLSQYTYVLKNDERGSMSEANKAIHSKYEAFLKANPNYVSWAQHTDEASRYTVHHKDEKVPDDLEASSVTSPDGTSYIMYVNWSTSSKDYDKSDLEKFTFTIEKAIGVTPENDAQIEKAVDFLQQNQDYMFWYDIDKNTGDRTSSIHHKDEKPPVGFYKQNMKWTGTNPMVYTNAKKTGANEVSFYVIENVPVFPGCENLATNAERRECMSKKITKHIQLKFNTDLAGDLGLTGRQRISVVFKINTDGVVEGIRSRANDPRLEEEVKRVISLLPKMTAGSHEGKNVVVPYSLPIIFQVEEGSSNTTTKVPKIQERLEIEDFSDASGVSFEAVENVPVYPACENLSTNAERRACMEKNITKHVQKKFNTDLAGDLGLKGRQRISVIFKINKAGDIIDVRSRASDVRLEEEAKRVIKQLPNMKPGKQAGENVVVKYALPIIFQVL